MALIILNDLLSIITLINCLGQFTQETVYLYLSRTRLFDFELISRFMGLLDRCLNCLLFQLSHLTTENPIDDGQARSNIYNAQELEDCDEALEIDSKFFAVGEKTLGKN